MAVLAASVAVVAGPAAPASAASGNSGYDISYPQCSSTGLGSAPATQGNFDILGVNDGIVYSANPCLRAEYGWATGGATPAVVSFYANTADPGPSSSHWPVGQSANGRTCPVQKSYRVGSSAYGQCSYLYGWNAAANSLADAAAATSASVAQGAQWWLDVEAANSWTRSTTANLDDIQGALDYLSGHTTNAGAARGYVGLYTNASSWSSIAGSSRSLAGYPFWYPGATAATAMATCTNSRASVTGGHIRYTQYQAAGFDNDDDCG